MVDPGTRRVLLLIAALLPALAIAACIGYFGVDSPHWDEWGCEGSVSRAYLEGRPALLPQQLISFCNESRPVFPKIFWLGISIATRNSRVAEMYLGWLFVCLTAWNLYHLNGRRLAPTAMMSALLFHPVQHENWLWGSQNMLFVPALCLTSMLRWTRVAFAAPVVATYSFANGMLLWPALFAILLKRSRPLSRYGIAAVLFLVFVPVYFIGFERAPSAVDARAAAVSQPIHYVLTFLGAPLAGGRSAIAAAWIGMAWLGVTGLVSLLAVLHRKVEAASTWWILGGYGLASAILAAWGRSHMGVTQAMENRYTAFSIWLAIAAIGLAYHVAWPLISGHRGLQWTILVVGFGLFGTLYVSSYPRAIREHNNRSIAGRYHRACLHFFEVLPGGHCTGNYPVWSLDYLRTAAPPLNRAGWIHPPLATTSELAVTTAASTSASVAITGGSAETGWKLQGMISGDPDAVILAIQRNGKEWEAVEVLPVGRGWAWNPEGVWSAELQPGSAWTTGATAGVFLYRASTGAIGPLSTIELLP